MSTKSTHKLPIRGNEWELRFTRENLGVDSWGVCLHDQELIIVDSELRGAGRTDTLIHEILHACLPDVEELAIGETAVAVTEALCELGYLKKRYAGWSAQTKM
jgi:hypothetical protein